jgi:DNA-binding response OmpR family regulator
MATPISVGAAGLRVLVAEDNADAAASLALLLRQDGHEVRVAGTGPAALAAARAEPTDAVLLDLGLPGLSGLEVARELRGGRRRGVPLLVAVTGHGREEDRQMAREAGIDVFLVKPVAPGELRELLERFGAILREGEGAGGSPAKAG